MRGENKLKKYASFDSHLALLSICADGMALSYSKLRYGQFFRDATTPFHLVGVSPVLVIGEIRFRKPEWRDFGEYGFYRGEEAVGSLGLLNLLLTWMEDAEILKF